MESLVECAQCGVLMASWSAPGSPTRYYRCPTCHRTVCSAYDEVIDRGTLARRRDVPLAALPVGARSSLEEARWRELKGRADRWFARLEADESAHAPRQRRAVRPKVPALAGVVRLRG